MVLAVHKPTHPWRAHARDRDAGHSVKQRHNSQATGILAHCFSIKVSKMFCMLHKTPEPANPGTCNQQTAPLPARSLALLACTVGT